MLVHVHVLVNAQQHCSCVYRRFHQYRMRRNYCRSVISLQEPLPHSLWISLGLHDILTVVYTPAYSVVSIAVHWPPKHRVYNITSSSLLHRKYILLLCCLFKVSQYRLALIDTAAVHIVKRTSQHVLINCFGCRYTFIRISKRSQEDPQYNWRVVVVALYAL